jgi:hypothetical protein
MSRFSPDKDLRIVGGNGMASLGKGIFYVLGGMFVLGCAGGPGSVLLIIVALILLFSKKK